jgi:hypothetical protein
MLTDCSAAHTHLAWVVLQFAATHMDDEKLSSTHLIGRDGEVDFNIYTLVAAGILLVIAALLWRKYQKFAWLVIAAAGLVASPAIGEPILWLVLIVLTVITFFAPAADTIRANRVFAVVVFVLGIAGLALAYGGIDMPLDLGFSVRWDGNDFRFQSPVKEFNIELQPPVVKETPTALIEP